MSTERATPPPELLARVESDLAPVRPLAAPSRRVALWLPLGLTLFLAVPLYIGLRADALALGPLVTWGASAAQMALGVGLLWAGAREGRPGRRLPLRFASAGLVVGGLTVLGLTAITFAISPTVAGPALGFIRAATFCLGGSLAVGAPLLFLAGWLLGRALPGQPWLAGALFGAGAGLTADASWRLVCPISDPWHVLVGHGGAVVVLAAVGSVGAYVAARKRVR